MLMLNTTDVRNEWSRNLDIASRCKPLFMKRTRDKFMLSDLDTLKFLLSAYKFNAHIFTEEDGSYTVSVDELDIVENAETEDMAKKAAQEAIYEYANDYYAEFDLWSSAPNRKPHIPYVLKALLCDSPIELELNIVA